MEELEAKPLAVQRPERMGQVWVLLCLCGKTIQTPTREFVCPHCHRLSRVDPGHFADE